MDIDDILREVDPTFHAVPREKRDLQDLTRAWVAERSAPELLPWPSSGLFERINDRIKRQIERVEEMTGDMDPKTNFALIVIQTELERYKYLVRSYLRARIAKIDRHTLHYLSTDALRARLSDMELAYATRHQALLHNHYLSSFLSSFPPALQNLNDTAGGLTMIDTPDLDSAVFIRLLKDTLVEGRGVDADGLTSFEENDIIILRWSDAKPLVESGSAELPVLETSLPIFIMADTYTDIVLITGANQGVGFFTAEKLATEHSNYHVILAGRRQEALDEAVAKLNAAGLKNVESLVLDVTSDESIEAAAKAVEAKHGRLDCLINNAGISNNAGQSDPRQLWLDIYNTNVVGVEYVTRAFIPLLKKAKGAKRIVNVTSELGGMHSKADKNAFAHKVDYAPYSITKSALNMLTLHYVQRFEDDASWKINLTCPGFCATNLNHYQGFDDPKLGAVNSCRLATLGMDGETGTWTNRHGPMKW
ncbi:DNA replication complex gins protein sld5 [Echria macrotheca]|uniref:DNA replication complex GINS protein SLD5 n=1 Tax=Echria macrotheca TaxID=438768 RepID=A0AAJ0F8S7_9PEZI|nr:DNA replication complex gins protein sld5 [Echria macrotheca]